MKLLSIFSTIIVLNIGLGSVQANSQVPTVASSEQIIGWNLTETDLRNMKIGDLLVKAGGEPMLNKIQAKANAPGGQFGMFVKKSKQDNIAPLLMGIAIRLGYYTGKTDEAARYYYQVSADLGNFRAMQELAGLLPKTEGTDWYRKAAEAGYPSAMNGYGNALANGTGVAMDLPTALVWFRKSAELGNSVGSYNMGWSYYTGNGVPKDQNEAVKWFQRAANTGDEQAKLLLTKIQAESGGRESNLASNIRPTGNLSNLGVESYVSKNHCVVEVRVNTPEDWLDADRMKTLVITHGLDLISRNACRDEFGRQPEDIEVVVRQKLPLPDFKYGTACPAETQSQRPWMCNDSYWDGNHLGDVESHGYGSGYSGVGVSARVAKKVVTDAQILRWGSDVSWHMFGNRPYEKIGNDTYLVSYHNSAIESKQKYEAKLIRDENARRYAAANAAETKRVAETQASDRKAALARAASQVRSESSVPKQTKNVYICSIDPWSAYGQTRLSRAQWYDDKYGPGKGGWSHPFERQPMHGICDLKVGWLYVEK